MFPRNWVLRSQDHAGLYEFDVSQSEGGRSPTPQPPITTSLAEPPTCKIYLSLTPKDKSSPDNPIGMYEAMEHDAHEIAIQTVEVNVEIHEFSTPYGYGLYYQATDRFWFDVDDIWKGTYPLSERDKPSPPTSWPFLMRYRYMTHKWQIEVRVLCYSAQSPVIDEVFDYLKSTPETDFPKSTPTLTPEQNTIVIEIPLYMM